MVSLYILVVAMAFIQTQCVTAKAAWQGGLFDQGKQRDGDANEEVLSNEKRMLLLKMKDLLENTLNDYDTSSKETPSVVQGRVLSRKRDPEVVPQESSAIPWSAHKRNTENEKRQASYSALAWKRTGSDKSKNTSKRQFAKAGLPWKRADKHKRELYKRLIHDVNELFALDDHTEADDRLEREMREVDELTTTFDRMA